MVAINPSKSKATIWTALVVTAGAGDVNSGSQDIRSTFGAIAHRKITNGATGPTIEATMKTQLSPDGTRWYDFGTALAGGTANALVTSDSTELPPPVMFARNVVGGNTAQNVTADADLSRLDSLQ
ncbi:MAG: hypothetical protein V3U03_17435 [Myxococcota bacterium]